MSVRSEPPSSRALRLARARGLVARSPVLTGAAVIGAGVFAAGWVGPGVVRAVEACGAACWRMDGAGFGVARARVWDVGSALMPGLWVLAGASFMACLVQVGPLFAPGALMPSTRGLGAAEMGSALRRVLSPARLAVMVLAVLVAAGVGALAVVPLVESAAHLAGRDRAVMSAFLGAAAARVVAWLALAAAGVGLIDLLVRRRGLVRGLWRTREEALRERREEEGDPTHAAARRRLHVGISGLAAMEEAKRACLVVAGGGWAAALEYRAGEDAAPRVTVAGRGWRALGVTRLAEEAGTAIAEDAGLAEELAGVGEGVPIPESAYVPVAAWMRRVGVAV